MGCSSVGVLGRFADVQAKTEAEGSAEKRPQSTNHSSITLARTRCNADGGRDSLMPVARFDQMNATLSMTLCHVRTVCTASSRIKPDAKSQLRNNRPWLSNLDSQGDGRTDYGRPWKLAYLAICHQVGYCLFGF
jgi:hypothetical protein